MREKRFELRQSFISEMGTLELLHSQHWGKLLRVGALTGFSERADATLNGMEHHLGVAWIDAYDPV